MSSSSFDLTKKTIDVLVRIGLLALLVAWCIMILVPFVAPVLWGILISIILYPVFNQLSARLGGRTKLSSVILTVLMLLLILAPSYLFFDSLISGAKQIGSALEQGEFNFPPPSENVRDWPLIGDKTFEVWTLFANNLDDALLTYQDQVTKLGKGILSIAFGTGKGILQFVFSIIIAGVLLNYAEAGNSFSNKFFRKIAGDKGADITELSNRTIRNVAKGIIGVAFIQAFLAGLGFLLAGVPYAGLWTLLVLMLAIMQLPPTLVFIPAVIYLFSQSTGFGPFAWAFYFIVVGLSDNILKPIMLGKGAPVPMLVIFLGSIGGFFTSGFIGLFVGAIILSLGYQLLNNWVEGEEEAQQLTEKTP